MNVGPESLCLLFESQTVASNSVQDLIFTWYRGPMGRNGLPRSVMTLAAFNGDQKALLVLL